MKKNEEIMVFDHFDESSIFRSFTKNGLKYVINLLLKEERLKLEQRLIEKSFFGDLIQLRRERNITQGQLAEKTGLSQSIISRMENERRSSSFLNIARYLLGLGIDINNLFI